MKEYKTMQCENSKENFEKLLDNAEIKLLDAESKKINLVLSQDQLMQYEKFFEIVVEKNKVMNLTSITQRKDFFIKHFLDSVLAHDLIPQNADVLDLGCGGGFPSIPLKIAREDLRMTAMDATNKKIEFVKDAIAMLGLKNTTAITARAEEAGQKKHREKFDVVVSRAVASLPQLLELALPLTKVGGIFIAYKTDESEVNAYSEALKELSAVHEKTLIRTLANADNRCFFVFRKTAKCSPKYPRNYGQIKKKPL